MIFDPQAYGPEIARILALDGSGTRLMPLAIAQAPAANGVREALQGRTARQLFPGAPHSEAALSGFAAATERSEAGERRWPDSSR